MKCSDLKPTETHDRLHLTVMIGKRSLEENFLFRSTAIVI